MQWSRRLTTYETNLRGHGGESVGRVLHESKMQERVDRVARTAESLGELDGTLHMTSMSQTSRLTWLIAIVGLQRFDRPLNKCCG